MTTRKLSTIDKKEDYYFIGGQLYGIREGGAKPGNPRVPVISLKALEALVRVHDRAPVTPLKWR
jgi:hypothetical protein